MISISSPYQAIKCSLLLPASKSISNRLLIINALSNNKINISNLSNADDTVLLQGILKHLDSNSQDENIIDCKNAGTVLRFLTSFLSLQEGSYILTGSNRMKSRPIHSLIESLILIGANIQYLEKEGFPPIQINGSNLSGGKLEMDASLSSQFISSIMMIGPYLNEGLSIKLENRVASRPYIQMTSDLMIKAGIDVDFEDCFISIPSDDYKECSIVVEPDWSSAAFWYEIAALSDEAEIHLEGLTEHDLQGDKILSEIYSKMGVETIYTENGILLKQSDNIEPYINFDFHDYPDLALPVITTCSALGLIGRFYGLSNLTHKESNRMVALQQELSKVNIDLRQTDDDEWVLINSCELKNPENNLLDQTVKFNSHDDHRIAMSLAPLSLILDNVEIENPEVVEKSYPSFWLDLEKAGFNIN